MIPEKKDLIKAIFSKEAYDKTKKLFHEYDAAFEAQGLHSGEELMDYGRTCSIYLNYIEAWREKK